jgi:hypothetical protein
VPGSHHDGYRGRATCNLLAETLRAREPGLVAFFDTSLTSGPIEDGNVIAKLADLRAATEQEVGLDDATI